MNVSFSLPFAPEQRFLHSERAIQSVFKTARATKHPGDQAAFHTGCFKKTEREKQDAKCVQKITPF